jgi:hypothetical protein
METLIFCTDTDMVFIPVSLIVEAKQVGNRIYLLATGEPLQVATYHSEEAARQDVEAIRTSKFFSGVIS